MSPTNRTKVLWISIPRPGGRIGWGKWLPTCACGWKGPLFVAVNDAKQSAALHDCDEERDSVCEPLDHEDMP